MRYCAFILAAALVGCNGDTGEETGTPCGSGCTEDVNAQIEVFKAEGVVVEVSSKCCEAVCTDNGDSATCAPPEADTYTVSGSIPNGACLTDPTVQVDPNESYEVDLVCALLPSGTYYRQGTCERYSITTETRDDGYVMKGFAFGVDVNGGTFEGESSGATLRGTISADLNTIEYETLYEGEVTTSGTLVKDGADNNDCD